MRWQRVLQALIAIFVIGFVALLARQLRREAPATGTAPAPPARVDQAAAVENTGGCDQLSTKGGRRVFSVKCGRHFSYTDGRQRFTEGVEVSIPRANGEFVIKAKEAEMTPTNDSIDTAVFKGDVRVAGVGELELEAGEATYVESEGMLKIPGPMKFARGRMSGSGVGATYDRTREVFWVLEQARVRIEANPANGAGAVEGTAGSFGVARLDHFMRFLKDARLVADGRTAQADDIVIRLTEDDQGTQGMELRGNSRIAGGPGGPQSMAARDIDLFYAEDGKSLQSARLIHDAALELAGAGKRIAATAIDVTLGPDGTTVTNLTATERVQVDLPAEGQAPPKRIRSTTLLAIGAPGVGLRSATFSGGVEYREIRGAARQPAGRGTAPPGRVATADTLAVDTKPGFGAIEKADFRGNFKFSDGPELSANAPQGIYQLDRDRIELLPGENLPGQPPLVTDGAFSVSARTIQFNPTTRELSAETKVRSTLQPRKRGASGGKLPSMLSADAMVIVTSNRLAYSGANARAEYAGNVTLWQDPDTTIRAGNLIIDEKTGNLTGTENVTTIFHVDELDRKTGQKRRVQTTGNAVTFTYDDARRVAAYDAKAHIVGAQGDLTGDRIELFLKSGANELERAEAYGPGGKVAVKEGNRLATGNHLRYTAADDQYLMAGTPVTLIEMNKGLCRRTIGATASFNRAGESGQVTGNGTFPTEANTLPSCPAALKR